MMFAEGYILSKAFTKLGSYPGRGKIFLHSTKSKPAPGRAQPPIQWVPGAISPAVERPGREADDSTPYSAKVKNSGDIPPVLLSS
jgi:hypothetical protein